MIQPAIQKLASRRNLTEPEARAAMEQIMEGGASEAVRYGSGPPRLMSAKWAMRFTRAARGFWTDDASARAEALWNWLESSPSRATKPKFAAAKSRLSNPNPAASSTSPGTDLGSRSPGLLANQLLPPQLSTTAGVQ